MIYALKPLADIFINGNVKTQKIRQNLIQRDLLCESSTHWQVSEKGRRFLNDVLSEFV